MGMVECSRVAPLPLLSSKGQSKATMRAAGMAAFVPPGSEVGRRSLFAQHLQVVLQAGIVFCFAHGTQVGLRAVAAPVVGVIPVAFEAMGKKQVLEIRTRFDSEILFAAHAAVGQLLVALRARSASNRRIGAAEGTAHDKLQVAVAYLRHGVVLLLSVYPVIEFAQNLYRAFVGELVTVVISL